VGDDIRTRAWYRRGFTWAGIEDPDGPDVEHGTAPEWKTIDLFIPLEEAKHYCCWQQTWGVGLPESAVDWDKVNEWLTRGDANHKKLARVILQAVHIDWFDETGGNNEPNEVAGQPGSYSLNAPAGYSCGSFIYPGKGCDYMEDKDFQTSAVEYGVGAIGRSIGEGAGVMQEGALDLAGEGLWALDTAIADAASSISFGLTGPITDALDALGDQIAEARSNASGLGEEFWTFTYNTGIFAPQPVQLNVLDYLVPGRPNCLFPAASGSWIKAILRILLYWFFVRSVMGMVLPQTVVPGAGGSGGNDD